MKTKPIIAMCAPVAITAGEADGEKKSPAKFTSTFYTGGALEISGWDLPVVVDLAGLESANVLVANQYHDMTRPVGNFAVANDGKSLVANGTATAATASRDEVVNSAADGYQWQASLEVQPQKGGVEEVKKGAKVNVNGQEFTGPLYVTRKGTLKGFAFVLHGADDNTTASIAAVAATHKEKDMEPKFQEWVEAMGFDAATLTDDQKTNLQADFTGRSGKRPLNIKASTDPFEKRKIEATRRREILDIADQKCDDYMKAGRAEQIDEIRKLADHAIEAEMSAQEFRIGLYEAGIPFAHTVPAPKARKSDAAVMEAALCQAGGLRDMEKHFDAKVLEAAHKEFRDGIGLNEFLIEAAKANGYQGRTGARVTPEIQNAAFGMSSGPYSQIQGGGSGFSTINVSNIVAATANKFLHEGWMAVDLTPLRIASIRSVRNFQQITTVSLTGDLQFTKLGSDGEIKHGTLADLTYTNQADTYAAMLAITRKDIINDDLGALTAAPRRLGRGGALKLNDIFWTEFLGLVSASFFAAGNSNINTGVADMTIGGLTATETIFMNQTDPDGKPLGIMPKILLVPTALKAATVALMDPQGILITGASSTIPAANVFKSRFTVESSPYISNSSYTGNTAVGYWMLADPNEMPVIEIAALNGRVEPTVETADAAFNVLGIQMRGYSDIGVNDQEKRGGVYADGGAS
jgi:hypothetical protein